MKSFLKEEFLSLAEAVKSLDKKIVIVFLSVAVLQTVSWYLTSRQFFHDSILPDYFTDNPNAPLYEFIYWFTGDFVTLFVIPFIIIKSIFKEQLCNYGINFNNAGYGIKIILLSMMIMIPVLWFASSSISFSEQYPLLVQAKNNMQAFIIFQFFLLIFLFAWEFFWRGFMLFGLKKEFGYYAVFIQMIPFVILHNGKPMPETAGAILGGLFLGALAYRTGSFFYGYIIHYFILLSIDSLAILRGKTGDFGTGLDSLFQIVSKIF